MMALVTNENITTELPENKEISRLFSQNSLHFFSVHSVFSVVNFLSN